MTDRNYRNMDEIERARSLWKRGVLLAEYSKGAKKMMLYQLHDIYVEVTLHAHTSIVMEVSTFTDTKRLEPYLENISLENLFT